MDKFVQHKLFELRNGYENFLTRQLGLRLATGCQTINNSRYWYGSIRFLCLIERYFDRWFDERWHKILQQLVAMCKDSLEIFSFNSALEMLLLFEPLPRVHTLFVGSDFRLRNSYVFVDPAMPSTVDPPISREWLLHVRSLKQTFPAVKCVWFNGIVDPGMISRKSLDDDIARDAKLLPATIWHSVRHVVINERKVFGGSHNYPYLPPHNIDYDCQLRTLCPNANILLTKRNHWPLALTYNKLETSDQNYMHSNHTELDNVRRWLRVDGALLILHLERVGGIYKFFRVLPITTTQLDELAFGGMMSWISSANSSCRFELVVDGDSQWRDIEKIMRYWRIDEPNDGDELCKLDLRIFTCAEKPLEQLVLLWMEQRRQLQQIHGDFSCQVRYKIGRVLLNHRLNLFETANNALAALVPPNDNVNPDVTQLRNFSLYAATLRKMVEMIEAQQHHAPISSGDCLPTLLCERLAAFECNDTHSNYNQYGVQQQMLIRGLSERNCTAGGARQMPVDAEVAEGDSLKISISKFETLSTSISLSIRQACRTIFTARIALRLCSDGVLQKLLL